MFSNPVAAAIFFGMIGIVVLALLIITVHHFRFIIWSGYMRVVFVGEDRTVTGAILKISRSDHDFEIEALGQSWKYGIDRERIYRVGRFRVPVAYYKVGVAEPLDMLQTGKASVISALDYAQVARNTVTRDLLASFESTFLNAQNIFMITIIVIAGGLLMLGVFVNTKFNEVRKDIAAVNAPAVSSNPSGTGLLGNRDAN